MNESALRILVVDDDDHIRNAISRLLRHHGYEVATSVNGEKALARIGKSEPFDAIIMDLLMPGGGGRHFVETVGKDHSYPLSRIIVLTAVHHADNATAYLQYGCGAYLGKPYENAHLLAQVRRICGQEMNNTDLDAIV